MKILVISDGKFGVALAQKLSLENHDVTIIGADEDGQFDIFDSTDIMCISSQGSSIGALWKTGAQHIDVLIAVTESDEINMLCCITAKKLGARYTIARIRDPEYDTETEFYKNLLDIDYVINPERNTAGEILRLLRFPVAVELEIFNQGRVEIVGFRTSDKDEIIGIPLVDLRKKIKAQILFCIVERDGEVHIPHGDFVIQPADLVYVAGRYTDITKFFRAIGRAASMAENVMILGGGRTGYYLANMAINVGIKPIIIEKDESRCMQLAADISHAIIICGDGTEPELLESENISSMDAFVALTGSDEENLMLSLFAFRNGVGKVVAKANRLTYAPLVSSIGVDSVVSPNEISASHILHFVRGLGSSRGGAVVSLHSMREGKVEALEFIVGNDMRYLGEKIRDLPIRRGVLIAVISRGNDIIIPEGNDVFFPGDNVVIMTLHKGFNELNDIFD
ncbi:MAG: Trk system potassium transporter TrkA [Oscillospiraceae bacterium]|nr:Trk system potassium transporter TrkA [Oscillospiraceae bacterium]